MSELCELKEAFKWVTTWSTSGHNLENFCREIIKNSKSTEDDKRHAQVILNVLEG